MSGVWALGKACRGLHYPWPTYEWWKYQISRLCMSWQSGQQPIPNHAAGRCMVKILRSRYTVLFTVFAVYWSKPLGDCWKGIWLFRRVLLLRNLRRTSFWGACRRLLFVKLYIFLISSFVRVWFLALSLQFPTLVAVRKSSFLEKVFRKTLEPRLMALNCVCRHEYVYLGCVGLRRGIVAGNTFS